MATGYEVEKESILQEYIEIISLLCYVHGMRAKLL
jgi:hypothetical protein